MLALGSGKQCGFVTDYLHIVTQVLAQGIADGALRQIQGRAAIGVKESHRESDRQVGDVTATYIEQPGADFGVGQPECLLVLFPQYFADTLSFAGGSLTGKGLRVGVRCTAGGRGAIAPHAINGVDVHSL